MFANYNASTQEYEIAFGSLDIFEILSEYKTSYAVTPTFITIFVCILATGDYRRTGCANIQAH